MASSDKNKKRSPKAGSSAARRPAVPPSGSKKASGGSSVAARPAKGQKAAAKDGKGQSGGLGGRWSRARQRARSGGAARSAAGKSEKGGLGKFFKDVRIELRKVTWPTRKDLAQSTLVVIVAVAIAGAYTGALDFIFSRIVQFFQGLMG